VLFHFSGHALVVDGTGYIVPMKGDAKSPQSIRQTCINLADLRGLLAGLPAKEVILVFDACRTDPTRTRGPDGVDSCGPPAGQALSTSLILRPDERQGLDAFAVLFSCKVGQWSFEWPEKRHGFFTYFLTRGLHGAAGDANGKVTLNSLEGYLAREVAAAVQKVAGRDQVPWMERMGINPGSVVLAFRTWLHPHMPQEGDVTNTVCVHNFRNIRQDGRLSHLGLGLAEGIASRLAAIRGINVVERSELGALLKETGLQQSALVDERTAVQAGQLLGAYYTLVGSFEGVEQGLKLNARLIENSSGRARMGFSKSSPKRDYLEALTARQTALELGITTPEPVESGFVQSAVAAVPLDEARRLFYAGKYPEAFAIFCRASDAILSDPELHRKVEKCARAGRMAGQFLQRYSDLTREHPKDALLHNYLGNGYLMIDRDDRDGRAKEQYDMALRLDPDIGPPLNNLGIIAYRQGDLAKAEALFGRYLKKEPEDAPALSNMGFLHLKKLEEEIDPGRSAVEAEAAFGEALRLDPILAPAYKGLGMLYQRLGRKADALIYYQQSLNLCHDQPSVSQHVDRLRWELGSPARPSAAAPGTEPNMQTRAIIRGGEIAELTAKTVEALSENQWKDAELLSRELRRLLPGNGIVLQLLSRSLEGRDRTLEARRAAEEARRLLR